MPDSSAQYVVTFESGNTLSLDGLRRMNIRDAQSLISLAARIPKQGRIIEVNPAQCDLASES